ncbi:iron-sulfur cluster carrier protein ApbC [Marinobacterium jannaschii]|uniref:iron-sulfur cluster carrier protein ApbC n=1 Tax=Marinobacterium jannaschii TaxID=64970 RepID=UPI0004817C36|nr:iron-sulfur cluster carrier protein ApbC [Marinobacterium jannaschii]
MFGPECAVIETELAKIQLPYLDADLISADVVRSLNNDAGKVAVELQLPYPSAGTATALKAQVSEALLALDGVSEVTVSVGHKLSAHPAPADAGSNLAGVKNIVAVASGKGGVGKSTTTVNLALAMAAEGARVGILDADIYGPSQGQMLGIQPGIHPESVDEKFFRPIEAHGLQSMSMGYLIDETTPMVWRGPMASGALQQLVSNTIWGELDYLFIDMPPGTGDIQLTLSQKVPVAGAVIVTTPQDIALLDAKKGIEMFRKVEIPVLGIVENMSVHICSNCGNAEHIFGEGGGERIAAQYETTQLGSLPLSLQIREQVDSGKPSVVADPEGKAAGLYRDVALKVAVELSKRNGAGSKIPSISVSDD